MTGDGGELPPRRARPVCYLLVTLLAVCALTGTEWWPLSSFQLFSRARDGVTTRWEIALLEQSGRERQLPVASLPRSFRGAHHVLRTLGQLPAAERDTVCRAYAQAGADHLGLGATEVRVYRVVDVPGGDAGDPRRTRRTLALACAGLP